MIRKQTEKSSNSKYSKGLIVLMILLAVIGCWEINHFRRFLQQYIPNCCSQQYYTDDSKKNNNNNNNDIKIDQEDNDVIERISNNNQQSTIIMNHTTKTLPISIVNHNNDTEKSFGEVQSLLDFLFLGHPKCGSTSWNFWFRSHPQVHAPYHEQRSLSQFVSMENVITDLKKFQTNNHEFHAMKDPSSIYHPMTSTLLAKHWPMTKLLIGIRHPVLWFQSLYNFMVVSVYRLPDPMELIGPCIRDFHVCTDHARFHLHLAYLGQTNMDTIQERELFFAAGADDNNNNNNNDIIANVTDRIRIPNPIFLYDTNQMSDKNETRSIQFNKDVQTFLGLQEPMPSIPHANSGKKATKKREQFTINICDDKYKELRNILMDYSQKTSIFVRDYFVKVDNVHVSSPEYLFEILETYMVDPCDDVNQER